jgi:hypothetical protein
VPVELAAPTTTRMAANWDRLRLPEQPIVSRRFLVR